MRVIDIDINRYTAFVETETMKLQRALPGKEEDNAMRRKAEAENVVYALRQYRKAIDQLGE